MVRTLELWMNDWTEGRMDEWMDGLEEGGRVGGMDRWIDILLSIYLHEIFSTLHQTYNNCLCIPGDRTKPRSNGSAKPGYCDRNCKNEILFAVLSSLILFVRFSTVVPGRTVILR